MYKCFPMAKKKTDIPNLTSVDSGVEQETEVLQPVVDNQIDDANLNQSNDKDLSIENPTSVDSGVEPLKAEIIEPATPPVEQIEDGRVQIQGANFKVAVSPLAAKIISKFK